MTEETNPGNRLLQDHVTEIQMSSQEEGGASHIFNQGTIGLIVMKDCNWSYCNERLLGLWTEKCKAEGRDPKHKMA